MIDRLTPFFTSVSKALREDTSTDMSQWDAMLDRPRELPAVDGEEYSCGEVNLIVGVPVYFPITMDEARPKL